MYCKRQSTYLSNFGLLQILLFLVTFLPLTSIAEIKMATYPLATKVLTPRDQLVNTAIGRAMWMAIQAEAAIYNNKDKMGLEQVRHDLNRIIDLLVRSQIPIYYSTTDDTEPSGCLWNLQAFAQRKNNSIYLCNKMLKKRDLENTAQVILHEMHHIITFLEGRPASECDASTLEMTAVKLSTGNNPRLSGYTDILSSWSKESRKQCSYLTSSIRELDKYAPSQKKFAPESILAKTYRGTDLLNNLDANTEFSTFPEIIQTERFDCYFVSLLNKDRHSPLSSAKGLYQLSSYSYSNDSDIHNLTLKSKLTGNEILISCDGSQADFNVFENEFFEALRPVINLKTPIKLSK